MRIAAARDMLQWARRRPGVAPFRLKDEIADWCMENLHQQWRLVEISKLGDETATCAIHFEDDNEAVYFYLFWACKFNIYWI